MKQHEDDAPPGRPPETPRPPVEEDATRQPCADPAAPSDDQDRGHKRERTATGAFGDSLDRTEV
jgi:hypothetical protein